MKAPYYEKCAECGNDFSCFLVHATADQKEQVILFTATESWRAQADTLREHQSRASKARHAKRTPEERSAYAKMMVEARQNKRKVRENEQGTTIR